jgi:hypothetical protein
MVEPSRILVVRLSLSWQYKFMSADDKIRMWNAHHHCARMPHDLIFPEKELD